MSIFAWGTGYRLDQYGPPHSAVHKLPKAKLLSKNEQTWVGDSAQSSRKLAQAGAHRTAYAGFHFAVATLPVRGLELRFHGTLNETEQRSHVLELTVDLLDTRPPPIRA